jgi:hypothetical protein
MPDNKPPEPRRGPCPTCGSFGPNSECKDCVDHQLAREVASLGDLRELQED